MRIFAVFFVVGFPLFIFADNARAEDAGQVSEEDFRDKGVSTPEIGRNKSQRNIQTSDPNSSSPIPGLLPELSPSTFDVLSSQFSVGKNGAEISVGLSPFALFLREYVPIITESTLRFRTNTKGTFGGDLILGYNGGVKKLRTTRLTEIRESCRSKERARQIDVLLSRSRDLERRIQDLPHLKNQSCVTRWNVNKNVENLTPIVETNDVEKAQKMSSKIVSIWGRFYGCASDLEKELRSLQKGQDLYEEIVEIQDHMNEEIASCHVKRYHEYLTKYSFSRTGSFSLRTGFDIFAFVREPRVVDAEEEEIDPTYQRLRSWYIGFSGSFFPSINSSLWVSASFAQKRPGQMRDDALSSRVGASLTFAHNFPFGNVQDDGFVSGIAVGGFVSYSQCVGDVDCHLDISSYSEDVSLYFMLTYAAFVDVRISTKLQFRLSFPVEQIVLRETPSEASSGTLIWRFQPLLSLVVAHWGLPR